jgi:fatty-acid desaturase
MGSSRDSGARIHDTVGSVSPDPHAADDATFLRRALKPPSYGWVSGTNHPSDAAIRRELLDNLAVHRDRRHFLTAFTWGVWAVLGIMLIVWAVGFASWISLAAGLAYTFLYLPQYGTFYFHRYGTHRAWRFRHPLFAWMAKHMTIRVIPEELYILSHHVHHRYADQDGDPYDPRGGWWYCFLADANHQSVAWDLDAGDYRRARAVLSHLAVRTNDYVGYQRWGMIAKPGRLVLEFVGNWVAWALVLWWLGGWPVVFGVFGWSTYWLWGIRNFNFRAHGRGGDMRVDGEDFYRGDLSVNRSLSAWLASEWHNHHHLFPRSARNGYLWWQLDVVYWVVRGLHAVGVISSYRDDTPRFFAEHYR